MRGQLSQCGTEHPSTTHFSREYFFGRLQRTRSDQQCTPEIIACLLRQDGIPSQFRRQRPVMSTQSLPEPRRLQCAPAAEPVLLLGYEGSVLLFRRYHSAQYTGSRNPSCCRRMRRQRPVMSTQSLPEPRRPPERQPQSPSCVRVCQRYEARAHPAPKNKSFFFLRKRKQPEH